MIVSDYFGSMDFISELGERKSVSRAIERKNVLKGKDANKWLEEEANKWLTCIREGLGMLFIGPGVNGPPAF